MLLWSPAVDLEAAKDPSTINHSSHFATDYLVGNFSTWGAIKFTKGLDIISDSTLRAYIVQLGHEFRAGSSTWICVGSAEILEPDGLRIGKELRGRGSMVESYIVPGAPHDVLFVGNILGFEDEAVKAAQLAHDFIENVT